MLSKNVASQGVYLYAYLTTTGLPKTGDAANITGSVSKDGAASAATATANPTEIGGGVYWQPLSQAETNANALAVYWASTTASVLIAPLAVLTDRSGVSLDLTQALADVSTATVGGALNGAHAVTWGGVAKDVVGKLLKVFSFGSATVPKMTFTLDDGINPTSRTPQ